MYESSTLAMKNKSIIKRSLKSVWHPCSQMKHYEEQLLIPIEKGRGSWLIDFEGKKYLDATSSWWVNLFGHNNATIKGFVSKQLNQLEHSMIAGMTHEPVISLSEQLSELTGLGHCFYGSDGANAIEIALKMSSHYWREKGNIKKTKIVYLQNSYHGETLGALSVTDVPIFREHYSQLMQKHLQVDSPDWRLKEPNQSIKEFTSAKVEKVRELFEQKAHVISSFILEPLVQCASGMGIYDKQYLQDIRKLCDEYGIHMIVDEIAVGFGRTGKLFAHQYADITPDFLCLSKGLTGGYLPLSVTLTRDKIYDSFYHRDVRKGFLHSHSYTGNPLACSAALGTLSIFKNNDVMGNNAIKAKKINKLIENHKDLPISQLRNIGMIWAFELNSQVNIQKVVQSCVDNGLFIRPINRTIYFMPPYTINDFEMRHMIKTSEEAIKRHA